MSGFQIIQCKGNTPIHFCWTFCWTLLKNVLLLNFIYQKYKASPPKTPDFAVPNKKRQTLQRPKLEIFIRYKELVIFSLQFMGFL